MVSCHRKPYPDRVAPDRKHPAPTDSVACFCAKSNASAVVLVYAVKAVEIAVFVADVLLYGVKAVEIAVFIADVLLYGVKAVEIAVFIAVVVL